MKKHTKIILIVLAVLLVGGIGIGTVIHDLTTYGYAYYGGWEDTPEKALARASNSGMPSDKETLTVVELLDIFYFEEYAELVYISEADTLVSVTCVRNSEGKWHTYGFSEEDLSGELTSFVMNGDPEQFILFPYDIDEKGKIVHGWKTSDAPPVEVNGQKAKTKTYKFYLHGKEWSIDYWWINDVTLDENGDADVRYGDA